MRDARTKRGLELKQPDNKSTKLRGPSMQWTAHRVVLSVYFLSATLVCTSTANAILNFLWMRRDGFAGVNNGN